MRRAVLVGLLLVFSLLAVAVPANAVETGEDHGELPSYEEIGTQNEISERFRPEGYEQPSVFPPIIYALLGVALLASLALLFLYLTWQPRFADEAQQRRRR